MKKILSLLIAAAAALNLGSCSNNGVPHGENNVPNVGDSSEDGKEKVSAEIALSFLTYNRRRAINILGVGALVAHFNRRKLENRG